MKNSKIILNHLEQFKRSTVRFSVTLGKREFEYSEGVKYLVENTNSYWLLILILSYQTDDELKKEKFQSWSLAVNENQGLITCYDGNDNELLSQIIPFTDFPLGEIYIL